MTAFPASHGGFAHDLGVALLKASSGEVALNLAAVATFLLRVAIALHVKARLLPRRFANEPVCTEPSVAIDGFGANFMSFSHLKEFRSDFVKIEASLVRDPAMAALLGIDRSDSPVSARS